MLKNKDRVIGLGFLVLALFLYLILVPWQVYVPLRTKGTVLSPAFFPKLISGGLAMLSLLLIIIPGATASKEREEEEKISLNYVKVTLMVIFCAVYVFLLISTFGFLPASIAFLVLFMRYTGVEDWKKIISISILVPLLFYYIFKLWADVPFPKGIFG